ncbi:ABC transporter permease [Methylocella tundrae]|uniref:Lipid kinase n=1 Tax=Methylocella tundrae TaxID=227605 RepID=A0A4U8Z3G4_METTU|nr:ABC transporter permease subunit [Methylocella tundrae]WPP03780.1 ABC transporter permease subunit [Methylocella tundrae]VFU09943.1 Lipid kinase [Methylocella tundrae]
MRLLTYRPNRGASLILPALPFVVLIAIYAIGSILRHAGNPDDKLLPGLDSLAAAVRRVAFEPDKRTGDIILWSDTAASLTRLGVGLAVATVSSCVIGLLVGLLPYLRVLLTPFIAVLSMIPPLAILPILFIVFGLGEVSKIVLIVIGIAPYMTRDLALRVSELPVEQLVKAQTLGATTWQILLRVVAPQMMPRLIDSVRLSLGAAWLYLIAAEAIAAESGLGYRIFLMRRYLAMDVILPYVAWITLLAFLSDYILRRLQSWLFPWFAGARAK